jgi:hypothetical protein
VADIISSLELREEPNQTIYPEDWLSENQEIEWIRKANDPEPLAERAVQSSD